MSLLWYNVLSKDTPFTRSMTRCREKILVVAPNWVGDLVMAQSLLKVLKHKQPDTVIHVLAGVWAAPLLARMPEVDMHHCTYFQRGCLQLYARYKQGKSLRQVHYTQAIVLPNTWKSAFIPFWAKIKQRTGWMEEQRIGLLNDVCRLKKENHPQMLTRYTALANTITARSHLNKAWNHARYWPKLTVNVDAQQKAMRRLGLTLHKPLLALCPGAQFGPAKQWPAQHVATLANRMQARGWHVWLFGHTNDQRMADHIMQHVQLHTHCLNLCGKTSLGEAIDLLALAQVVVSNDSGLMHIAAALQRPVVALYGATSPEFAPPLCQHHTIFYEHLPCQPCRKRHCPLAHFKCMRNLSPEKVAHAIERHYQASA